MTEAEMTILLKQKQFQTSQQGQKVALAAGHSIQQVSSGGQVTRISGQLVTGAAAQQVAAVVAGGSTSASTLTTNASVGAVKAGSSTSSAALPVTIPVTAVSLGITVNVPQHKTITGIAGTNTHLPHTTKCHMLQLIGSNFTLCFYLCLQD